MQGPGGYFSNSEEAWDQSPVSKESGDGSRVVQSLNGNNGYFVFYLNN